jgi:hypothetical protein
VLWPATACLAAAYLRVRFAARRLAMPVRYERRGRNSKRPGGPGSKAVASAHACGNYCAYSAVYCVRAAVCGSVEADLASFSANPDRPRCPKCRRNTFRCWSGGDRQNSAIRLHARRPGSQRREWQSAKGALRRSRPPRPLSPSPVSPNAEGASPRACLCFVAALGRDRRD